MKRSVVKEENKEKWSERRKAKRSVMKYGGRKEEKNLREREGREPKGKEWKRKIKNRTSEEREEE